MIGYNYRMEAIQGAVLGVKLKHLDDWNAGRRRHAGVYYRELANSEVRLLEERPDTMSSTTSFLYLPSNATNCVHT